MSDTQLTVLIMSLGERYSLSSFKNRLEEAILLVPEEYRDNCKVELKVFSKINVQLCFSFDPILERDAELLEYERLKAIFEKR